MESKKISLDEQVAHCDGADCVCGAYALPECSCGADWTTEETYILRANLAAKERELAALKDAMETLRISPCKYPPWRDAREVVEWIERRAEILLRSSDGD